MCDDCENLGAFSLYVTGPKNYFLEKGSKHNLKYFDTADFHKALGKICGGFSISRINHTAGGAEVSALF